MPAPFLTGSFRFLQQLTVSTFGGPEKIWWPATPDTVACTVPVACAAAAQSGQGKELAGLLTLPTDERVFYCTLADFPFTPRPEMVFVFGPEVPNPDAPPATVFDPLTSEKFVVKSTSTWGEQLTITAELHSRP